MMRGGASVINDRGIVSRPREDNGFPDPRGVGCVIFNKLQQSKNCIAQLDGLTGEQETYESLLLRCVRTALTMQSMGVTREDNLTISSYNSFHNYVPYIAGLFLGAKVACIDPELSLLDTSATLNEIRPKLIFAGPESLRSIEESIRGVEFETQIIAFEESTGHQDFSSFLMPAEEEDDFRPFVAQDVNETAVIIFSSGATGPPKGSCISHKAILSHINYLWSRPDCARNQLTSQLIFIPLYWIPTATIYLNSVFFGKCSVIYPKFNPHTFWKLIETTKVSLVVLTPTDVQKLCEVDKPEKVDISCLSQVIITGGPVLKEHIFIIREIMPDTDVINLYGTSEAGGYVMSFRPHMYPEEKRMLSEKPESCGRPGEGISCKIIDSETGEILGAHQKGELRIKTDAQMSRYLSLDSSKCWDADGWLKTGEVAYYDEDCCFFIVDRKNDMIKFRSWYLAPAKIEGVLISHPAVKGAVVIGLPHPEDGARALGVVVLNSYAVGIVTEEDLREYVELRVEDQYRLRGGVRIVDCIPMTSSGKNKRDLVKQLLLNNQI